MRFELRDADVAQEPGHYYEQLRQTCPVAHVDDYEGFWILSRYDDVLEAARNGSVYSSAEGVTIPKLPIPPQICLEQDEPEHARYRRPMQNWLSSGRVAALEDTIREVVKRLIDSLLEEGEAAGSADVVEILAEPLPAIVMAMVLGLPESDWPAFREQMSRCVGSAAGEDAEGAAVAAGEMVAQLAKNLAERRATPRKDLLTEIANLEVQGVPLTEEEAISMSFLLLGAGHETTVGAIGGLLYYLAREPELQQRLKDDPSLQAGAVEEALRLVSPLPGMGRTTTCPVSVGDVTLDTGARVMLMYGSANRDPAVFDRPEEFVLGREQNRHVAFGNGAHRCVGAPLARLELRVVLEEVLRRVPRFTLASEDAAQARYGTSRGYRKLELAWWAST